MYMDPFEASANSSIDTYINLWSMWMHSYHMFWLECFIIPTYMFKVSSGNLIYCSFVTSSCCFGANSLILYNQKSNPFWHMARLDPKLHLWCLSVSRFTGVGVGIAKFMGSTRGPPGSCVGPINLAIRGVIACNRTRSNTGPWYCHSGDKKLFAMKHDTNILKISMAQRKVAVILLSTHGCFLCCALVAIDISVSSSYSPTWKYL